MKYRNRKVTDPVSGTFDSQREYDRWRELQIYQLAGKIDNLQRQVKFELIPAQRDANGKAVRAVTYIADFVYDTPDGQRVVEDSKGFRTKEYQIKKKLMLHRYGITIQET